MVKQILTTVAVVALVLGGWSFVSDEPSLGTSRDESNCVASTTAYTVGSEADTTVMPQRGNRCGWMISNNSAVEVYWIQASALGSSAHIAGNVLSASTTVRWGEGILTDSPVTVRSATGAASTTAVVTEFIFNY